MAEQNGRQSSPVAKGDRLVTGSVFTFVSIIAVRIATVVNSIVIIRVLGPADYGVLSIVTLTISLAATISSFQIPSALVKFLATVHQDRPEEANRLLGAGLTMTAISTIITVAVLLALSPVLAFNLYHEPRVQFLLVVASLSLILSTITSPLFATFQAFERIKELGMRSTAAAFLSIPSTVALVVLFGLEGAVVALLINAGISVLVNVALLRSIWRSRNLKIERPRESRIYRKLLDYAIPAFASTVVSSVILWFCGTQLAARDWYIELGRYSAGYGLASYVLFITSAIGVPLVPIVSKLSNDNPEEMARFMARTMRVGLFLTLLPTIVLLGMPEPFLRILYGSSYVGASDVVRVIAPAIFLASISAIVGFAISGTGKMKSAFLLNFTWGIPVAIISVLLVPIWRENGLAVSILIAYICLLIMALAYARREWSVNLGRLGVPMLVGLISILTAAFISTYSGVERLLLVAMLMAGVVASGLIILTEREFEVLMQPLKKVLSWFRPHH